MSADEVPALEPAVVPDAKDAKADAALAERSAEIKARRTARVPNVKPKTGDQEEVFDQKMLEENLAKMANQVTIVNIDQTDEEKTFDFTPEDGKIEELKDVPAIYFKNCTNGRYVINRRVKNMMIQNCTNCTFEVNQNILTRTAEVWRGGDLKFNMNVDVKTLQLDMLTNVELTFTDWKHFNTIVYNQLENLDLKFLNGPEHNVVTGFAQMKAKPDFKDSNVTDQFIIRFVDGVLLPERCIRLKNGHLSTEREAIDWERRNNRARDEYMQKFMKNAGIALGRDEKAGPKIPVNSLCPCGSGRKYKRCCLGKKEVTGLATTEKKISYRG